MGLGWMEIGTILVVAMLLFGPERLPSMARQAAQWVRIVRQMANDAKSELTKELGDDFADINLRDLDPRTVVRDTLWSDPTPPPVKKARILRPDEVPPWDVDAT